MSQARYLIGDVFERMAEIPDGSVDLIVTSPPFLALRSYLPADHPDKDREIGSETTPAAFLSTMLALTDEWRRVLAPHGSLCVELGDTYSGANGWGDDAGNERYPTGRSGGARQQPTGKGWPLAKSLCLLPTLYPASLAYGWNMLDPAEQCEPWRVRNVVVWHRPNPPVGALGDKVRPSTSYVTIACTAPHRRKGKPDLHRWFDLDAERTAPTSGEAGAFVKNRDASSAFRGVTDGASNRVELVSNPAGAPPLDYWELDEDDPAEHQTWTIPTQPYSGSHYATFPVALPRRLIRLMCPQHVCRTCGEPRRRIVEAERPAHDHGRGRLNVARPGGVRLATGGAEMQTTYTTLGWSDCGHDDYRRGVVLDPFAGSGTTLVAASEQGRDSIGIDLDARNLDLARERCGLFLEVEEAA